MTSQSLKENISRLKAKITAAADLQDRARHEAHLAEAEAALAALPASADT